ncbi:MULTISPECIES: PucR family transcriptional regulator [unclassified Modestobacter]|uniref:PucR family transcriptional regulator n=1 Tax=unclassified Modestobacter TaxID=2643866 RepID=UPI0022AAB37D|nr:MULTISPECIES: helix-turn-helix domain-containing protein [unclassified Modestobacter]MCZ2823759.1 helix-turn-helix domain-containing protein [Modestobacter sp. VKM Ac-2981]MCZ2852004.1 helix-turn-helix domain-containing protein [Modestobacter sp. VKM Ac-2982]
MTDDRQLGEGPATGEDWLDAVASSAAAACSAPVDLLGDYLPMLADAAIHGRRPAPWELAAVRELGRRAAAQGVSARGAVDLYLSASWRLWRQLPAVVRSSDPEKVRQAGEAVLRVLDDAVGVLVDGHQSERREMIRHEEALRRGFVDDLLRGDADVARMVARAEPFGIDLGKAHHVALAAVRGPEGPVDRAAIALERAVVDRFGDRDVLVATKDARVVVVVPAGSATATSRAVDLGALICAQLDQVDGGRRWRVAAGRAFPGAYGVARSYEEAREALVFADRLGLDTDVVHARDLLVYRVLGRDQAAIADLVGDVLGPLQRSRNGAGVLLETLLAYFDAGDVATEAAQRLHVSVRTVTYRLARVAELSGYSVGRPDQRLSLHAAVLGARLLEWPARPLPLDT